MVDEVGQHKREVESEEHTDARFDFREDWTQEVDGHPDESVRLVVDHSAEGQEDEGRLPEPNHYMLET